jgi:hypothetical protein
MEQQISQLSVAVTDGLATLTEVRAQRYVRSSISRTGDADPMEPVVDPKRLLETGHSGPPRMSGSVLYEADLASVNCTREQGTALLRNAYGLATVQASESRQLRLTRQMLPSAT